MTTEPVILINLLKVEPANLDTLLGLLKESTETIIRSLDGWRATRLIAARDAAGVVIYSEWDSLEAAEAMRADPRMQAYFPKVAALASMVSITGGAVFSEAR